MFLVVHVPLIYQEIFPMLISETYPLLFLFLKNLER
jgi:hypothetical protein